MIVAVLSNECNSFVIYLTDLCVRKIKRRTLMRKIVIMAALLVSLGMSAQEKKDTRTIDIHGTIRDKYEYKFVCELMVRF